jgi:catechol 2,3-dioxygenase-like lactoylglutathione lyase family enzyme
MLRVLDPAKSVAFYTQQLGFTLLDIVKFPAFNFDLYFLTTLSPKHLPYKLEPGS